MKKMICSILGLCVAFGVYAQEVNVLKNGGFEKITRMNKNNPTIKAKMKQGWTFGKEQSFILPQNWILNVGAADMSLVDKAKAPKDVHGGKYALKMTVKKFAHIFTPGLKPGKYTVTFWAKGNGTVTTVAYCYGAKGHYITSYSLKNNKIAAAEWKKFTNVVDTKRNNAKVTNFAFALSFGGSVIVDDIALTPEE